MQISDVGITYLVTKDGRRWGLVSRIDRPETNQIELAFRSDDGQNIQFRANPDVYTGNKDLRTYLLDSLESSIEEGRE